MCRILAAFASEWAVRILGPRPGTLGPEPGTPVEHAEIGRESVGVAVSRFAGTMPEILGVVWPTFEPNPALGPNPIRIRRFPAGSLKVSAPLHVQPTLFTLRPRRLGLIELVLTVYGCVLLPSGGGRACPDQMPGPALGAPRSRCRFKKPSMDQRCAPSLAAPPQEILLHPRPYVGDTAISHEVANRCLREWRTWMSTGRR